jgi:hypothetical protein
MMQKLRIFASAVVGRRTDFGLVLEEEETFTTTEGFALPQS